MKYKLLIVDDDDEIRELVKTSFAGEKDFQLYEADNGKKALQLANSAKPDLILLDVMLPDMAGYEIASCLRNENNNVPVVFMSGTKIDQQDKAAGFLSGADDYLVKPFAPREMVFRVKAILNRTVRGGQPPKGVKIDSDNMLIHIDGKAIEGLTPTEFKILALLLSKSPDIVQKEEIVQAVWKLVTPSNYRSLEVYIQRLRKKLGDNVGNRIETVPTKGYRYSA
jgi:DNA-binding response OmpR family regulator